MPILRLLAVGAAVYLGWCLLLFLGQRAMLFPTRMVPAGDTPRPPAGFEVLFFEAPDGPVEGWYRPAPASGADRPGPLMIFCHGNAESIDSAVPEMAAVAKLGFGLLAVEYPGYGRSAGRPSQTRITAALVAAYDTIRRRPEVDAGRIVACGRSLGGGAACALAERRPLAGLILVSTFTGVRQMARRYLVPAFLVRDPFDNETVLSRYAGPVLLVHGRLDATIAFDHARRLDRVARRSRLVAYDCDHNDCPPDWERFWRDVRAFLVEKGIIETGNRGVETGNSKLET